ncbi:hypothetical protein CRX72_06625 [Pantoea sp. BRM17]|nr:hypothetical protein CRX72_06625 [Pantoea sp. BRM17]
MVRGLRKLRNLGQGYVNFGEPLPLVNYLNKHIPEWREAIDPIDPQRPAWMTPAVNDIGYSVEYFVEGGRSRTGRLLDPKTGTLSMTLQALLRGGSRPITFVPIYIGYEHVMEVGTYAKELRGADYLLLSYVLYHQGLVPPHIAAGINLNFWPAGPIFRRLGAFFIRRTFKGNKLYSTVFREYLGELFSRQQNAVEMMEEIAADFSYEAIRVTDRIMGWLWSRLYQGISVNGGERVRQLAQDGHEIVYVPCHRSHIEHGTDKSIAQKLARVARIHFARQRLAAVGPSLPARQDLFNKLLQSKAIEKAVEDEARSKKISHEKANNPQLDVQMLPVAVMFGRAPGREIQGEPTPHLRVLNGVQKFFAILWHGRDSFVRFSSTVSLRQMATDSKADLLTLRNQCLRLDLPDPLAPLEIDGTLLPRHVFIHDGPRVFPYYVANPESVKLFHDYLDLHRRCTFWYACRALLTRGFKLSMSGWRKLYYKLLNLPLSILVKSKVIPTDPVSEHGIDPTRPVMYVLP